MSANKAFKQWMKQDPLFDIGHETDCRYYGQNSLVPVDSTRCNCHDKAIFRAGYFAARGVKE